ncbi:hypothetical protein [Streptomyces sp. AJS327]|uniref:hypothetical protein n=1 Tax=Streptomyces sp. AJS327 TaxID=2545265 RepID=UPI0015DFEFE6|nr:hypothetical protein [Streptomyces sp. AJS327]
MYELEDVARDLVIAALAVRVFGPAVLALLRRVAAAGVRAGVTEMSRRVPEKGGRP